MIGRFAVSLLILFPIAASASLRGNFNTNYRQNSGLGGSSWSSTQIMNLFFDSQFSYSNDLTLGANMSRVSNSLRTYDDFKIRYNMNMRGYRYIFFASYSPYKMRREVSASQFIRLFQASLIYSPKMLPDISMAYSSSKKFTKDDPRTIDSRNHTWNISSRLSKSIGTLSVNYRRQVSQDRTDVLGDQTWRIGNITYELSKILPGKISFVTNYGFTGNDSYIPGRLSSNSLSHSGAAQAGRAFGKWFSLSASVSGRRLDFEKNSVDESSIRDFSAASVGNLRLRDNLSLLILRNYSRNRNLNGNSYESKNDYMNVGLTYQFQMMGGRQGNISYSRSIYYSSNLGKNSIDNMTVIADFGLYRETDMTVTLGVSRSEKSAYGTSRYQITDNINIVSRPLPNTSASINYQAARAAGKFVISTVDNETISAVFTQILKRDFTYTLTYTRSLINSADASVSSSYTASINYRLSRKLTLLITYSGRDSGNTGLIQQQGISHNVAGRLGWSMTRRSSLAVNFSVNEINRTGESRSIGGYFVTSF